MLEVVFNTIVAMKILKEQFKAFENEWKMIIMKAYVYLKRKHLLDELAVDRMIESIDLYYR